MLNSVSPSESGLLAGGWEISELEDGPIEADGLTLRRTGVAAKDGSGVEASGAAVSLHEDPRPRAFFELFERTALLDASSRELFVCRDAHGEMLSELQGREVFPVAASDRCRMARSNGVALGRNWNDACNRALYELAERDAILRSWLGGTKPVRVSMSSQIVPGTTRYLWEGYRLQSSAFARGAEVAFVIGRPTSSGVPLVRGSSARANLDDALAAAMDEALQMLGFLWGEEIPSEAPSFSPSPIYHLDHYLWPERHALLTEWLRGGRERARSASRVSDGHVKYAEIKSGVLPVARAMCEAAIPLWFGDAPSCFDLSTEEPHPIA